MKQLVRVFMLYLDMGHENAVQCFFAVWFSCLFSFTAISAEIMYEMDLASPAQVKKMFILNIIHVTWAKKAINCALYSLHWTPRLPTIVSSIVATVQLLSFGRGKGNIWLNFMMWISTYSRTLTLIGLGKLENCFLGWLENNKIFPFKWRDESHKVQGQPSPSKRDD